MLRNPLEDRVGHARRCALVAAGALCLLVSTAVHAGLGELVDSIGRDHLALGGKTLTVTPAVAYDIHETTTADGARIRQYVSRSGTVFAVAWSARTQPDLSILLAKQHDAYISATNAHHGNRHVFTVSTPELVISVLRVPRGFEGAAHVPALVPAGTSTSELR